MNIGLVTNCFTGETWEEICRITRDAGIRILEVVAGGLNGTRHCNPAELLKDRTALRKFSETAGEYGVEIKELTCMGNPVHPNVKIARDFIGTMEALIELADELGVKIINTFAGCPGAAFDAMYPNWIGLPYPPEFEAYVKWQWEERIIPFWKDMVKYARPYGIKFGFEMHPGDAVYNTTTLLKLREAVGEDICCKFDHAHLVWQGMDPIACIKRLGNSIASVHAQDIEINRTVVDVDGVLDSKNYANLEKRAWVFRLVGYGSSAEYWKKLISTLKRTGYEGSVNIEHLDALISVKEGIRKAKEFLESVIIHEKGEGIRY